VGGYDYKGARRNEFSQETTINKADTTTKSR
jgi:hypothetical protein